MTHKKRPGRTAVLLLAAAAVFMTMAVPAAGAGAFGDVSASAWYAGAVSFVSQRGLFQGTAPGVFSPNGTMTRAMFVTVLGRYAGADASSWCAGSVSGSGVNMRSGPGTDYPVVATLDAGTALTIQGKSGDWYQVGSGFGSGYIRGDYVSVRYHTFSDVAFGSYYAGYAIWAYEKNIIEGDGSSAVFSPNKNITREQACTILNRFAAAMGASMGASGSAVSFTDDGSISGWARDSVYALSRAGIIQGRETGAFDPAGNASRAEAAAIIQRFDNAVGGFTPPPGQQGSAGGSTAPPESSGTTPPEQSPEGGENTAPPEGSETAPPEQSPEGGESTAPPEGSETSPPEQAPENGGLLANAALVDHLSQGDRGCCLATSFSMAANLILGRNEYGPFDWTASETNDGLYVPSGTSFLGTDGRTYYPGWSNGGLSEDGLRAAIDSALGSGLPIIVSVRNASTANTHYVLVLGWTDSGHSDYLIADPSGGGTSLLESAMPMAEKSYLLGNKDGTYVYVNFK